MVQNTAYLITGGTGFIGSHLAEYILENKPIVIYGDGKQSRDYVYVKIAEKIANLLNKELNIIHAPSRPAEPKLLVGSYEKAKRELGWEPEYTFEEGLKETVLSYKGLL